MALAGDNLAMEPRVLILDEASSMLDPRGRKGLMKACHALHDRGMTIVMITHFMEEAAGGRSCRGISGGARCHARYARGNLRHGRTNLRSST